MLKVDTTDFAYAQALKVLIEQGSLRFYGLEFDDSVNAVKTLDWARSLSSKIEADLSNSAKKAEETPVAKPVAKKTTKKAST